MNPTLTPRQTQALSLLADGLTRKQIAGRLKVSQKTVDFYFDGKDTPTLHWAGIYERIGTNSVALLARWADHHGLCRT